ncbi:5106_t:CDS:1, partial [Gigaspora rosea]
MIGMMAYIEPQCYIQHGIKVERKEKSDIYSLGVLLWELTSGIPPFNGYNFVALSIAISNNKREKPINGTPIDFVNLYEKCWSSNPDMRPAMNEILAKIKSLTETSVEFITNNMVIHSDEELSDEDSDPMLISDAPSDQQYSHLSDNSVSLSN